VRKQIQAGAAADLPATRTEFWGCAEVRADEAEREATTTILSLGFAVRPRAGCAFFSALELPARGRVRAAV